MAPRFPICNKELPVAESVAFVTEILELPLTNNSKRLTVVEVIV